VVLAGASEKGGVDSQETGRKETKKWSEIRWAQKSEKILADCIKSIPNVKCETTFQTEGEILRLKGFGKAKLHRGKFMLIGGKSGEETKKRKNKTKCPSEEKGQIHFPLWQALTYRD